MKIIVQFARILVGALFIFSGLVKAIDPLGLAYKMQEFFDVWAAGGFMKELMFWFNEQALFLSILIITMEVILGVALLLGWRKNLVSWMLLLLMLLFTFLTSYVLFSGKIRACGCFGDCIPLTPLQTFTKDIILTVLVLLILFNRKYINPIFSNTVNVILFLGAFAGVLFLQWYVLKHLPLKDCLPFRVGNDILELRKMPANAIPDKYEYTFIYSKGGEEKEFAMDALPDSTWEFVDRKQVLAEKGSNNIPIINDFILKTASGNDTTAAVLSQPGDYFMVFAKDFSPDNDAWYDDFRKFVGDAGKPVYLVTANPAEAVQIFNNPELVILTCDVTAIKTAARVNPTLFKMKGPVIQEKHAAADYFNKTDK